MFIQFFGAGVPDDPASAGTGTDQPVENISDDVQITPEPAPQEPIEDQSAQLPDDQDTDLAAQFEEAIKEQPNDTDLIKRLRNLAKVRYDEFQAKSKQSAAESSPQQDDDLVKGLFGFDRERGVPTAREFAEKLAAKDPNVAEQALFDLSNVVVNQEGVEGFTLGHKFLQSIGLDPFKLEELRAFSRGEISSAQPLTDVPDFIPSEYAEAYQQMPQVLKNDVDIYMTSDNADQKTAAMQLLQDRQKNINADKAEQQRQQQVMARFEAETTEAIENDLTTTYQGLLDTIKQNPAYTGVKISSNDAVDSSFKNSIISQINALGDPRSLLANTAAANLKALGVEVDMNKVNELMADIQDNTEIIIKAERMGKAQNRDFSQQIQSAKQRRAEAISRTLALANKYFSDALSTVSKGIGSQPPGETGLPRLDGDISGQAGARKSLTLSELDNLAVETAKRLQAKS